jgi:hypothetical protein
MVVAGILTAALVGFEIFNFDTTRFALMDLMGGHRFLGVEWAAILAFAFCSIDFAGVVRMFTPEQSLKDEPQEVLLLMGAWLLGASLNAIMTWYAVALVIAPRPVGATLITKDDMLLYAPVFVALLVWLTRILLIGASSMVADRLMNGYRNSRGAVRQRTTRPQRSRAYANGGESFQEDFFTD